MIEFLCRGLKVEIDLDKGIYQAEPETCTGKTYLYSMIRCLKEDDMLAISCEDLRFLEDEHARKSIFSKPYKLIMIDCYDLYNGYLDEYLQQYRDRAIVIIDLKQESKEWIEHMCKFGLTKDKLEISELY